MFEFLALFGAISLLEWGIVFGIVVALGIASAVDRRRDFTSFWSIGVFALVLAVCWKLTEGAPFMADIAKSEYPFTTAALIYIGLGVLYSVFIEYAVNVVWLKDRVTFASSMEYIKRQLSTKVRIQRDGTGEFEGGRRKAKIDELDYSYLDFLKDSNVEPDDKQRAEIEAQLSAQVYQATSHIDSGSIHSITYDKENRKFDYKTNGGRLSNLLCNATLMWPAFAISLAFDELIINAFKHLATFVTRVFRTYVQSVFSKILSI